MLHLLRASAGAGKTHRLVQIYLQHILASPTHIPDIVVLSFTNKATQELKERILAQLHDLATSKETAMASELKENLDCDTQTLAERAQEALNYLLSHYDQFAVHTIDTFFQNLLRTFSYELGIPSTYQLLLEQDQLLDHCIAQLLQQLPETPTFQEALTELALQKIQEGRPWHFAEELTRWGKDFLKTWQDPSSQRHFRKEAFSKKHLAGLSKERNTFVNNLSVKARNIVHYVEEAHLEAKDFAWGEKGIIGFLKKLQAKKIVPPSTRLLQASIDPTVWVSKKSPDRHKILPLVESTLQPLFTELLAYYTTHYAHYATSATLLSLRHRLLTTQKINTLIHAYMDTHDVVLIHTVPQHIKETIQGNTTAFLYAKTGKKPQHFLIDESQDLSTAQWLGISPLIQQLLTQQKKSYLVGDAKQAIYRWRGGNPQLLLTQVEKEVSTQYVQKSDLPYNWRSKPTIVDFNNTFFPEAADLLATYLENEIPLDNNIDVQALHGEIAHIRKAYAHATQTIPPSQASTVRGYVNVSFIKSDTRGNAWKEVATQRTIQAIERLQEAGYQCKDITLLVRNNIEARILLQAFLGHAESKKAKPHLRYDAVAKAALSLAEDPHISLLITALASLDNPTDPVILARLKHGCKQYAPTASWQALQRPGAGLQSVSLQVLYLIHVFGIEKNASEAHLSAFKEIVHDFSLQKDNSLPDFLTWWDKYGSQKIAPAPATKDAIQIMTIHQAKGLAFNVVILPFCGWGLDHSPYNPPMIWGHTEQKPFDQLATVPLSYTSQLKETFYASGYIHEKWQQYLEQLNLLYVAFTRARDICYIFSPYSSTKNLKTTASLLSHLLTPEKNPKSPLHNQGQWDPDTLTWEAGVLPTSIQTPLSPPSIPTKMVASTDPAQHKRILQRIETSHKEGIWWHDFLQKITTQDDIVPLLQHYVKTERLSSKRSKEIESLFDHLFEDERLRGYFSSRWQIYAERTIVLPSGTLWRPDRVMIHDKKAIVLDFKLGVPLPIHHEQVRSYMEMMTELGYENVEGYLLSLAEKKLIEVT